MITSECVQENSVRVPLVSVIVLNYNGLAYLGAALKECLDSVIECNYPHLEVIFVDNGSSDGSAIFVQENYRNKITTIKNDRNLGFSEGFNTGIRASRGEYLALLSNDMVVDRDWLKPIIKLMESDHRIGVAGCKILVHGTTRLLDGIGGDMYLCGRLKIIGSGEVDRGQYDANMDNLDYVGGVMILRRRATEQVGLFDPDFFVFSEDVDLCFRMRKAGYKVVYVYDAVVWHRGSATFRGMDPERILKEYIVNQNRIRINLIHFRLIRLFSAFLIDFVWFVTTESLGKGFLLKAYMWNLKHMPITLKKRLKRGPSPPYGCKYAVHPFLVSNLRRRVRKKYFSK